MKRLLSSQLRRNMASGLVVTAANTIAGLVAYPFYLSYLGAETYGLWLVLSVVLTFSLIGMLGIPDAIVKLVSEAQGDGNSCGINRCVSTALLILCAMGLAIVVIVFALRRPIVSILGVAPLQSTRALCYVPLIAVLSMYVFIVEAHNAVLSGLGRMDQANYVRSIGRLTMPAVCIALLALGFGLKSLLIGNATGYVVTHIASAICIHRLHRGRLIQIRYWDRKWAGRILGFGGAVSAMSLLNMLLDPFNKLILTRCVGLQTVPVYEISCRLSQQLRSLFQTILRALLPEISREYGSRTPDAVERIRKLNWRSVRLVITVALPVYILLMFVATPLLKAWLGNGYMEAMPGMLRILLMASFLCLLATPIAFVLLAMGWVRFGLYTSVIQAVTNVVILIGVLTAGIPLSVHLVGWITLAAMAAADIYMFICGRIAFRRLHGSQQELEVPKSYSVRTAFGPKVPASVRLCPSDVKDSSRTAQGSEIPSYQEKG